MYLRRRRLVGGDELIDSMGIPIRQTNRAAPKLASMFNLLKFSNFCLSMKHTDRINGRKIIMIM